MLPLRWPREAVAKVQALVVPGSGLVKEQAEYEASIEYY